MNRMYLVLGMLCLALTSYGQTPKNLILPLKTARGPGGKGIVLSWRRDPGVVQYNLDFRYPPGSALSGRNTVVIRDSTVTSFYDSLNTDQILGYSVSAYKANGVYARRGMILQHVDAKPRASEGKVIVLVQQEIYDSLRADLDITLQDMRMDGWWPVVMTAASTDSVRAVKRRIVAKYREDSLRTTGLFIIGYVPIPYSGQIFPDGHGDHEGAWPADMYYADMRGKWTDATVNWINAGTVITSLNNVPGDGKWDQNVLPSTSPKLLGTGRVTFNRLPVFSQRNPAWTDIFLTRRYLRKLHRYKTGNYPTPAEMLIDDEFSPFTPSHTEASTAWQDGFASFGERETKAGPFLGQTQSNVRWMMAYMSGPGGWDACGNVATAAQLAASDSINAVFTTAYGSYFGDWFLPNNYMRALLASKGGVLSCSWNGRPAHYYEQMTHGEPLATIARGIMGTGPYTAGSQGIYNAIMGDITLHLQYIRPPGRVTAIRQGDATLLHWKPTADLADGYYIYRCSSDTGMYYPITQSLMQDTVFVDPQPQFGRNYYQVKAVRMQTNPQGVYPIHSISSQSAAVTFGRVFQWTGAQSSDWHSPSNWNPAQVPGQTDSAYIPATSHDPRVQRTATVGSLGLGPNARVNLADTLILTGNVSGEGILTGAGTAVFKNTYLPQRLNFGLDTMRMERICVQSDYGLRILKPLQILQQLDLVSGTLACEAPVRLVGTPRHHPRLGSHTGTIANTENFFIDIHIPPSPAGAEGSWHLLSSFYALSPCSFFSQNNPLQPGTIGGSNTDTSSVYYFNPLPAPTPNAFLDRGWRNPAFRTNSRFKGGLGFRVFVKTSAQGSGRYSFSGMPISGAASGLIWRSDQTTLLVTNTLVTGPVRRSSPELWGNPYPCPVNMDAYFGVRPHTYRYSMFRYDPGTDRYSVYMPGYGEVGPEKNGPILGTGRAAFIYPSLSSYPAFQPSHKHLSDTIPDISVNYYPAARRLRMFLKDSVVQSEVLISTTREASLPYSSQLRTNGPVLAVGRTALASILTIPDSAAPADSIHIYLEGLHNLPTKIYFEDEGLMTAYDVLLRDRSLRTLRRLNPPRDSQSVENDTRLAWRYDLVLTQRIVGLQAPDARPWASLVPNPTAGGLEILWEDKQQPGAAVSVRLSDMTGKTIATYAGSCYSLQSELSAGVRALSPGLYSVQISTANRTQTLRLIKR